jgi:hypothetical protein
LGNQVFRLAEEEKKKKRRRKEEARSLEEISKNLLGEFKTENSLQDDKF